MYAYRKMLALDEIHKTKGKICSYVLKCDGDAAHRSALRSLTK